MTDDLMLSAVAFALLLACAFNTLEWWSHAVAP